MDERVISALHDVAMTGRVRRLGYEHAEEINLRQAQRDLAGLGTWAVAADGGVSADLSR